MGKLRLEAQSTASRMNSKTGVQSAPTNTDTQAVSAVLNPEDIRREAEIADAAAYAAIAPDPHDSACLPDLAEAGEVIRGKTVYGLTGDWDPTRPGDQNVMTQFDSGQRLDVSDDLITYGFFTGQHATGLVNSPGFGEGKGYTPFTEAQKDAARIAIGNWDEYIDPEFEEVDMGPGVKGWAQNKADIWLANTFTGPAQAWAYFPGYGHQYTRVASDVWIADPRFNGTNLQLDPGFYGLQTLNHELGHSLGLDHPGLYNFGDDTDGDGEPDPITYEGDAFFYQDNQQYTIMSYFDMYEAGNNQVDWNFMRIVNPSTPMVNDIWAIQQIYGVEEDTRTGNTTYGFNATPDVENEAMIFEEGELAAIFTIWDAAGEEDTLDLSGYHSDSVIDLREGAYSSAGGWNAYGDAPTADPRDMTSEAYLAFVNAYNIAEGYAPRSGINPVTGNPVVPAGQPADYFYRLYFVGDLIERDAQGNPILDENGDEIPLNEGIPWAATMGYDWLMENNIGIAYGAVIENAIGGFGDDRINGNQAQNDFTGGAGADTFIIADYSTDDPNTPEVETTADGQVFVDTSIDRILDFETGVDTISLCTLGVEWADLNLVTEGTTTTVTVDRDGDAQFDDLTFIVIGSTPVEADFTF